MKLAPVPHNCRLWPLMLPLEIGLEEITLSLLGSGVVAALLIWITMPRYRPRDVYN